MPPFFFNKIYAYKTLLLLLLFNFPQVIRADLNLDEGRHSDAVLEFWALYLHLEDNNSSDKWGLAVTFFDGRLFFFYGKAFLLGLSDISRLYSDYESDIFIMSNVKYGLGGLDLIYGDNVMKRGNGLISFSGVTKNYRVNLKINDSGSNLKISESGVLSFNGNIYNGYVLTDLSVDGTIDLKGNLKNIRGQGMLQHIWSDSMSLENNYILIRLKQGDVLLLVFRMDDSGLVSRKKCGILKKGADKLYIDEFDIRWTNFWKSNRTKRLYPTGWIISSEKEKINLSLEANFNEQEGVLLSNSYWIGVARAHGKFFNEDVNGDVYIFCNPLKDKKGLKKKVWDILK